MIFLTRTRPPVSVGHQRIDLSRANLDGGELSQHKEGIEKNKDECDKKIKRRFHSILPPSK